MRHARRRDPGRGDALTAALDVSGAARAIIERLALAPHPEGGFYRETFRTADATAIYFLLPTGAFSAFHRVRHADEAWHFYDGDPIELVVIEGGVLRTVRLGRDLANGEVPQAVVPRDAWQAAAPIDGAASVASQGFSLCGCTVAPAFAFAHFEMPDRGALTSLFPEHAATIRRFTRER